ncbi:TPA: SGNH/GDSL hydrolase family protein [Serratia marcescens]
MANSLPEQSKWEETIYQIEKDTPVLGGPGGPDNAQAQGLANRTQYLKSSLEVLQTGVSPYPSISAAQNDINNGKIPEGAYFHVRAQRNISWVDEYQNVNHVAVYTGKSLADASAITPFITPTEGDPDGTLAGQALTRNGQYYLVYQHDDAAYPFVYYMNDAGTAKFVERLPGPVAIRKANILVAGKNLFNVQTITSGYYLFEGSGKPTPNPDYCYSDYISVEAGAIYSSDKMMRVITFYDSDYNYLSDEISKDAFTAPVGSAYVRLSIAETYLSAFQLSFGTGVLPYEAYQAVLPDEIGGAKTNILEALNFAPGKNLFDPNNVLNEIHLSSIGTIYHNEDKTMSVSGFIPVVSGASYCCNQQWLSAAYYDARGIFISRQNDPNFKDKSINKLVIPDSTAFMRIEVLTVVVPVTMVEMNDLATAFEPFKLVSPEQYNNSNVQFGDEAVDPASLLSFTSAVNLFSRKTALYGYINEYGAVYPVQASSGADYVYSDYIPVIAGTTYTSSLPMRFTAFYDADKKFITTLPTVSQVVAPAKSAFLRLTTLQANADTLQLVEGKYLPPRDDYMHVMAPVLQDGTPVRIPGELVLAEGLSLDFVSHGLLVPGTNIYNSHTIQPGYIDEWGIIHPGGTSYCFSDFIPVKPNTQYALNLGARFVSFYAKNKAFIRTEASSAQTIKQVTTDSDCCYLRVTMSVARSTDLQLEEGTVSSDFEPFAYSLLSALPDGTPVTGGNGSHVVERTPDSYGLERLRETHMRLLKLSYGDTTRLTYAMIGDSYTRGQVRYALKVAQKLWNRFNNSPINTVVPPLGCGWRSFGFDQFGDNTDIVGTVINQSTDVTCAYNIGHGPDISATTLGAAGATISYTQDLTQGFTSYLFAEGGAGVVQYQATGMADPIQIDLATYSAGMQIIPLSLPTTGSAAVVTWTCVTAPAVLYGVKILHPTASGVVVHKLGGSGSHTNHWINAMDARWLTAFENLGADLVTIMLGTNDQGAQISPSTFRLNLLTMIDRVRSVRPTADVLLICPAENNRPGGNSIAMKSYAEAMFKIARDDRDVAYINMQQSFGVNPADYAAGSARPWMVGDGLHPTPETGGYAIAASIIRALNLT